MFIEPNSSKVIISSTQSLSISKTSALTIFHARLKSFTKEYLVKFFSSLFNKNGSHSSLTKNISSYQSSVKFHVYNKSIAPKSIISAKFHLSINLVWISLFSNSFNLLSFFTNNISALLSLS